MGAIYLVRHGQASFGAEDYDALSGLGVRQAQVLGQALRSRLPRVDRVLCGTMLRHRQTAEACLTAMGLPAEWEADAAWNEYDHEAVLCALEPRYRDRAQLLEELAGAENPRRAFQQLFSRAVGRWASGVHDADYAEPWSTFCARVEGALVQLGERVGRGQTALVFTSGGPIAALCRSLLRIPDEPTVQLSWTLANAAVTKLVVSERGLFLSTLNEHAHFEGEHAGLLTYR